MSQLGRSSIPGCAVVAWVGYVQHQGDETRSRRFTKNIFVGGAQAYLSYVGAHPWAVATKVAVAAPTIMTGLSPDDMSESR